ncbi:Mpv17/PMP22 family protein [Purpureocillium lilacinum]|nr:Mpv17/PMP22 family protein [Purpureocillium lilacinum]OAQ71844.1 Mpv17/PMP22 family protein [Purpureocillium lilacinum]OAQ92915.1 Mpv17/PMP22 family protein [Purpureocillium lilacinum]GJN82709.1 hypothetical protein PLIIFM63780_006252 [Purpureocillium lilacinum]
MSPLPLVRAAAARAPIRVALRPRTLQFRMQTSSVSSSSSSSTAAAAKAPTPPPVPGPGSGPASAPTAAAKPIPTASATAAATGTTASSAATTTAGSAAAKATTPPLWRRLGLVTRAVDGYANSQRKRPYTTQLIGAFVIYLLADLSAQRIGGREHDPVRTGRTVLIGLVAAIPHFKWFVFLSRNFNYASRTGSIATKVLVNQAVFAPTFNTYFFGAQALLSGEDLAATGQRLRDTLPPSLVNSFKVWPATMAVAFAFLPFEFRAIFSGCVAVGWQTYLSYLNRQAELKEHARALTTVADGQGPVAEVAIA